MSELWDLYNENREHIGRTHERGRPIESGCYHIVVEIWTMTKDGQVLLTQRHPDKHFGLKWECTGGSVTAGETSMQGALRELAEEIGLTIQPQELKLVNSVRLADSFIDTYLTMQEISITDLRLQPEEVVDAKLVSASQFVQMMAEGIVVPKDWSFLFHRAGDQKCCVLKEYNKADRKKQIEFLLSVWEGAVRATHSFLSETDIFELLPLVRQAVLSVERLIAAVNEADVPFGFIGIDDGKVEMLFVAPFAFGQGIGKSMLIYAMEKLGAGYVDVNEQNSAALGFYQHMGFSIIGRSETDGQGNPFPILHLKRGSK